MASRLSTARLGWGLEAILSQMNRATPQQFQLRLSKETLKPGMRISPSLTIASSQVSDAAKMAALVWGRSRLISGIFGRIEWTWRKWKPSSASGYGTYHKERRDGCKQMRNADATSTAFPMALPSTQIFVFFIRFWSHSPLKIHEREPRMRLMTPEPSPSLLIWSALSSNVGLSKSTSYAHFNSCCPLMQCFLRRLPYLFISSWEIAVSQAKNFLHNLGERGMVIEFNGLCFKISSF